MTVFQTIVFLAGCLFVCLGVIFVLLGSIGLVRFPDFYTRSHAVSKIDTLGIILTVIGAMFFSGFTLTSFKLLLIIIFVMIANPAASHALAHAAYHRGLLPWKNKKK